MLTTHVIASTDEKKNKKDLVFNIFTSNSEVDNEEDKEVAYYPQIQRFLIQRKKGIARA